MLDRKIAPEIHPINVLLEEPEVLTMPNGIDLTCLPAKNLRFLRVDILFRGGSWVEEFSPVAQATISQLKSGTAKMTSAQLDERLDAYGARLQLFSSEKYSLVRFTSLVQYFSKVLELVREMIESPSFEENRFEILREQIKVSYQMSKSKVDRQCKELFYESVFGPDTPMGRRMHAEDISSLSIDHMRSYHKSYIHSGNCMIFITGPVNDSIVNKVEDAFGRDFFGSHTISFSNLKHFEPRMTDQRMVTMKMPVATRQAAVRVGGMLVPTDVRDEMCLQFIMILLGGGFCSRLNMNIREDKGYTYGIMAKFVDFPYEKGFFIATETANEYVDKVFDEIDYELGRLSYEPVSDDEMQMTFRQIDSAIVRRMDSPLKRLATLERLAVDGKSVKVFMEKTAIMKSVTPDEVMRCAKRYFKPESILKVCVQ